MKYLTIPLLLLLTLIGILLFVGDAQWVQVSLLSHAPDQADALTQNEFSLSLQLMILVAVCSVIGLLLLWSLGWWAWRLPRRVKTGFGRKRAGNGLEAIEEALLSSESGDGVRAQKQAKRARELLSRPALTDLVSAKAALADGNLAEAKTYFTALCDADHTKTAGLHGLADIAFNAGEYGTALGLAQQAYSDNKSSKWAFDYLFKSQIALNDWQGALDSLELATTRKHIDKTQSVRHKAALYGALASHYTKEGKLDLAMETAERAVQADNGFAPACALAAHLLADQSQAKKAAAVIDKAWKQAPHPALSLALRDVYSNETMAVQHKKLAGLIKANPDHRESILLSCEMALDNKDYVGGLRHISAVTNAEEASARVCMLAAVCEDGLGNKIDGQAWRNRAATAPIEANWSDLDPEGPSFNYTQTDWQRLIVTYGEQGVLIHPRLEAAAKRRSVTSMSMISKTAQPDNTEVDAPISTTRPTRDNASLENVDADIVTAPTDFVLEDSPIDEVISEDQKSGLGKRLSNLLDKK